MPKKDRYDTPERTFSFFGMTTLLDRSLIHPQKKGWREWMRVRGLKSMFWKKQRIRRKK